MDFVRGINPCIGNAFFKNKYVLEAYVQLVLQRPTIRGGMEKKLEESNCSSSLNVNVQ